MTSTRCSFCAGSGRSPAEYAYGSCQFCGGRGWVVDPMTRTANEIPLPNLNLTTKETA